LFDDKRLAGDGGDAAGCGSAEFGLVASRRHLCRLCGASITATSQRYRIGVYMSTGRYYSARTRPSNNWRQGLRQAGLPE
jgi:hypothetical protein